MPRPVRPDAVGVDGCPGGWVVASRAGVRVESTFAEVLGTHDDVIAVDMPIGLPAAWGRACDAEARRFLGRRAATIFPTPPRGLVHAGSYAEAAALSRRHYGRGLSVQTFNLFPKIRDVDSVVAPASEHRVAEAHPECAFLALTGAPLAPKRTVEGRAQRLAALAPHFGPIDVRVQGARPDDVLDAYALVWTAERFRAGTHMVHGDGARDERGLVMRIVT